MIMRIEFFVIQVLFFFSFVFSVSSQTTELFFSSFKKADPGNLTLTGVAGIQHNGLLRLTNQTSRLLGHCFYSSPVRFKNPRDGAVFSFSTTFAFAIVPQYPTLGGHGLAFAVSPTVDLAGAIPSNYLGLFNSSSDGNSSNHLFAVEFDTVQDFGFRDINGNHVGIDINSIVSKATSPAGYFDDNDHRWRNITLQSGRPVFAWIEYDSGPSLLNVTLSPNSTKPRSPSLSFPVDLSLVLHDEMYVGFSASTGLLASSHYIMGWSFKINGQAKGLDSSSLPSITSSKKKNQTGLIVGVSVSAVVLILSAIAASIFLFLRIKNADVIEDWEFEVGPHRFSYAELKKATKRFNDSELLGRGGFGRVYRGTLPGSKTQVAVKRVSHESKQGLREFVSEIASISRLRHRHLVQLLGWCRRRGDLLLVYEFMPYGSLDKFLFDNKPEIDLNWDQRFKIIRDVASALLYLHEGYEQVVLHRDVKASNVLLDGELNGRLGDFGLARLYDHGSNPGTTRVVGTLGYLAPEVSRTGKFTTGSDVYAFGMFLLEVVCGRRPIEPKIETEDLVLVDLVWSRFKWEKALDVVDPKLGHRYNESEVLLVIKLGLMCTDGVPKSRPSMRQAVRYLDREIDIPVNFGKSGNRYDESEFNVDRFDGFEDFTGSTLFDRTSSPYWNSHTGTGSGRPDSITASPVSPPSKTM